MAAIGIFSWFSDRMQQNFLKRTFPSHPVMVFLHTVKGNTEFTVSPPLSRLPLRHQQERVRDDVGLCSTVRHFLRHLFPSTVRKTSPPMKVIC